MSGQSFEIRFRLTCATCGWILFGEQSHEPTEFGYGFVVVAVNPCPRCKDDAAQERS